MFGIALLVLLMFCCLAHLSEQMCNAGSLSPSSHKPSRIIPYWQMTHVMKCPIHTPHTVCICAVAIAHPKNFVTLCCHTCRCMTGSPVSMTAAASERPPHDGKLTDMSVQTSVCSLPAVGQEPAGPPQVQQPTHSPPSHTQSSAAAAASAASGQNESTHMPSAQQSAAATNSAWTDRLPQTLPLPWPLWKLAPRSNSPSPPDPTSTTQMERSPASVSASPSSPERGPNSLSGDVRDACQLSQGLESSASPAAAASRLVTDPYPASQDEQDSEPHSQTPAEATTRARASSANSIVEGAVADSSTQPASTSEVCPTNGSGTPDAAPDDASGSPGRGDTAADAVAYVTADLRASDSADCMSSLPVRGGKSVKLGTVETQALTLEQKALLSKGLQLSKQMQQVCCDSTLL